MQMQRIVVKLGTSVLTDRTRHLSRQHMLRIVQQAQGTMELRSKQLS